MQQVKLPLPKFPTHVMWHWHPSLPPKRTTVARRVFGIDIPTYNLFTPSDAFSHEDVLASEQSRGPY
jgi:hypothetical protein